MPSKVPLSCLLKKKDLEEELEPTTLTHSFPVVVSGHRGRHWNTRHTSHTHTSYYNSRGVGFNTHIFGIGKSVPSLL